MAWARASQPFLCSLIAAGVVVQFFLAGAGAFHASGFEPHRALGWGILIVAGIEALLALAAVRLVRRSALLLLVVTLQSALGVLGADTQAWFGGLHAVNALAVMAAAGTLAHSAWLAR
jgi:hypothetical protein